MPDRGPDNTRPRADSRAVKQTRTPQRIAGQWAALCFGAYFINIVSGKVSTVLGLEHALRLGNIPELLLLVAAVVLFVATALFSEAAAAGASKPCDATASTQTTSREL